MTSLRSSSRNGRRELSYQAWRGEKKSLVYFEPVCKGLDHPRQAYNISSSVVIIGWPQLDI